MGGLYHFGRLIDKYARHTGALSLCWAGREIPFAAAVLAVTEDLTEGPGGAAERKTREMVCRVRAEDAFGGARAPLQSLRLVVDGQPYAMSEVRDYGGFSDLFLYRLHSLPGTGGEG